MTIISKKYTKINNDITSYLQLGTFAFDLIVSSSSRVSVEGNILNRNNKKYIMINLWPYLTSNLFVILWDTSMYIHSMWKALSFLVNNFWWNINTKVISRTIPFGFTCNQSHCNLKKWKINTIHRCFITVLLLLIPQSEVIGMLILTILPLPSPWTLHSSLLKNPLA